MSSSPKKVSYDSDDNSYTGRQCKFCFGTEETDKEAGIVSVWMSPCKCDGSIKWVHERCFKHWLQLAPYPQQSACSTCRFNYIKSWQLKPISEWSWPSIKLTFWDCVEVCLDMYSTFKMLRGIWYTVQGRKSIIAQLCYFFFWKTFIFTERRVLYYKSIMTNVANCLLEPQVRNAVEEKN